MKIIEWEAIDEQLYTEAGESELVQVSRDSEYLEAMELQVERVLSYLREKYPERAFRKKWNSHDFGSYCEVIERMEYEEEENDND